MASNILQLRQTVAARCKTVTNEVLRNILRGENLGVSGVKAELQRRILSLVDDAYQNGDTETLERIRYRTDNRGADPPRYFQGAPSLAQPTTASPTPNNHMASPYGRPQLPPYGNGNVNGRLNFKPSDFFNIEESLSAVTQLPDVPGARHTVKLPLQLSQAVCDRLRADKTLRVMLYCAQSSPMAAYGALDVEFPVQFEVRVNQDELKFNHKGLKKRPGTTKPADLTDAVRKSAGYFNEVQITYALTTTKFSVIVYLIRKISAAQLTERISHSKYITKEQVIREMKSKADDPDIIATSTVMSLRDPISTLRMALPCRSTVCQHNQCFDVESFLQLQEQAPTWTCPICNKTVSYQALAIDQYVQDILQKTSADQVTIEPTGEWRVRPIDDSSNKKGQSRAAYDNDDSDDDIVEIPVKTAVKPEPKWSTPSLAQQTPPLSSRETSVANTNAAHRPGQKRQSAVIDLTMSDEDEPPRPAKRAHNASSGGSYNTPGSMSDRPEAQPPQPPYAFGHMARGTSTLPPLPSMPNGFPNGAGQRLPWPTQQHPVFNQWRDHQGNYASNSPS